MAQHSNLELFSNPDPRFKILREKWCAGVFGVGYEKFVAPCHVAINDRTARMDADFFLQVNGGTYPFQTVEAMAPERRRGDEYKQFATGNRRTIPYEPERGHDEGPGWIAVAIESKRRKSYAGAAGLNVLVYANFSAYALGYADLVEMCDVSVRSFASVWVLTHTHIGSLHVANGLGEIPGWGEVFDLHGELA